MEESIPRVEIIEITKEYINVITNDPDNPQIA